MIMLAKENGHLLLKKDISELYRNSGISARVTTKKLYLYGT